jgi:ATP-dependent Clp protease ATP-binding subunit ClpA
MAGTRIAFGTIQVLTAKGFSPDYGARELRRVIQREIETPLSRQMIDGTKDANGMLRVRIEGETLAVEREG